MQPQQTSAVTVSPLQRGGRGIDAGVRLGLAAVIASLILAGCGWKSSNKRPAQTASQRAAAGDGPPNRAAVDPFSVPNAVPRPEPRSRYGNPTSYEQFGRRYHVLDSAVGYRATGDASWYGSKFHGRRTSSGERYDMFKMTAAHPTLPIPSYVRVRHLGNGRQIIVRVNDRGPFHGNRIIDLSWTAATKLGITQSGTARVAIEALDPNDPIYAVGAEPPLAPTTPITQMSEPVKTFPSGPPPAIARSAIYPPGPRIQAPPSSIPSGPQFEPLGPEPAVAERAGGAPMRQTAPASPTAQQQPSLYERLQTQPEPASAQQSVDANAYLQFGAYRDLRNATAQRDRLTRSGIGDLDILDSQSTDGLYRVVSGPHTALELAAARARYGSAGVASSVFRPKRPNF